MFSFFFFSIHVTWHINSGQFHAGINRNDGITSLKYHQTSPKLELIFQFLFSRCQASFSSASHFEMTRTGRGGGTGKGMGITTLCQDFHRTGEYRVEFWVRSRIVHAFLLRTPVTSMRNLIFRGQYWRNENERDGREGKRTDDKRTRRSLPRPDIKRVHRNIVIDFTISIEPIQWNVAASMLRPLHLISNRALLIAIRILSSENTASETHHRWIGREKEWEREEMVPFSPLIIQLIRTFDRFISP